jgi:hypothetical protein
MDFTIDSTATMNPTTTRWKKYCVVANNLHELLFNPTHNFTNENRQHALKKFLDKDNVQGLLPQFVRDANDIKRKLNLFENLKIAYAQFVAQKSKETCPIETHFLPQWCQMKLVSLSVTSLGQLVVPDTCCPR